MPMSQRENIYISTSALALEGSCKHHFHSSKSDATHSFTMAGTGLSEILISFNCMRTYDRSGIKVFGSAGEILLMIDGFFCACIRPIVKRCACTKLAFSCVQTSMYPIQRSSGNRLINAGHNRVAYQDNIEISQLNWLFLFRLNAMLGGGDT